MADYLRNTSTEELIKNVNLGRWFKPPLWVDATQSEIDAYLLIGAKAAKLIESDNDLATFRALGFVYTGWTFSLGAMSAMYAKNKNDLGSGGVNKYKFYDVGGIQRDFTDAPGFQGFSDGICDEDERLMELFNNYIGQIAACTTVAEVDAITIDYSA